MGTLLRAQPSPRRARAASFLRISTSSTRLRMRRFFGVISSSSSSSMNSRHSYSDSAFMEVSFMAVSAPAALRMEVRCFWRQTLTSMSPVREFWPTIMPV